MPLGLLSLLGQLLPGKGDVVVGLFDFMLYPNFYKNYPRLLVILKGALRLPFACSADSPVRGISPLRRGR